MALQVVRVAVHELPVLLEVLLELLADHLVAALMLEVRCGQRQTRPVSQKMLRQAAQHASWNCIDRATSWGKLQTPADGRPLQPSRGVDTSRMPDVGNSQAVGTCVGVRHPPGRGRWLGAGPAARVVADAGGPHVHGGLQLRLPHVRLREQEQRQRVRVHRFRRQAICATRSQPVSWNLMTPGHAKRGGEPLHRGNVDPP